MSDSSAALPNVQPLLTWTAPTRPHYERSTRWYTIGGVVVVGFAAYGIITNSWLFSIVTLLCGAVYFLQRNHVPTPKQFVITDGGVVFDEHFTRWGEIERFWVIETPTHATLHIRRKGRRTQDVHILVQNISVTEVKTTLGQFVPEDQSKQEGLFDIIIRICKL